MTLYSTETLCFYDHLLFCVYTLISQHYRKVPLFVVSTDLQIKTAHVVAPNNSLSKLHI